MAAGPKFSGFEDALGRDDAGDQFGWRNVEARIVCPAVRVGDTDIFAPTTSSQTPSAQYFALVALFYWNVKAGFQIPVYRGQRNRHIKWNAVPMRQHGFRVSADFVG